MTDNHSSAGRLAFPPPGTQADNAAVPAPSLNVEGSSIKLNDLGPMVVNSDGTVSRIANWSNMSEAEQA